ncbi:MAG: RagB/SusD family nutrient uptake outer membrane protein [Bacteroidales bacterium]|nr:RagB/SusD family nutrient uptake outer membrane protein [Bacteroidales bacterium]MBQ6081064.1 RagB/SusD family nutrient uptake outer membrane protein [Bacteroidales bacterium]MBQ9530364.1 RagB/SusD family nutrient uptake outer membrane protein [Bacteroidales bacterium]
MKKIYNLFILAFAALVISPSCSQLLEPEPYGLVDLDLVWTKYNYTSDLVSTIGKGANYESGFPYAAYSDEAQAVVDRTPGGYYSWYNVDFNAATYIFSGNWGGIYNNLRTIAFFLTNENKISFTNVTDLEREFWDVKAHFYRAWHYFTLMKRYGKGIIFTEVYDINEKFSGVKLNNVEQIADFIIQELDLCLAATEDESSPYTFRWTTPSFGAINRGFAWVLKARTAMYAASPLYYEEGSKYTWEYAYQINKQAVEALHAHGYKLFDRAPEDNYAYGVYDYYHLFDNDASRSIDKETILGNGGRLSMWSNYGLPTTRGQASCGICPTQELVDCYETIDGEPVLDLERPYLDAAHLQPNYNKNNHLYDPQNPYANRDPRFYGTIYYNGAPRYWSNPDSLRVWTYVGGNCGISDEPTSVFYTRTGYYVRKYNRDKSSEREGNQDGRAHNARLAEMYLNLAECACEAGHLEEASDYTSLVRERVGMPALPSGLTQDQLRLRIRNERRVEFAFEGTFRFDDVRRWKIIDQTEEHVTGMRIIKDDATNTFSYNRFSFGTRTNKGDDKYLLCPLPEDEVEKMKMNTSPTDDPEDGDDWQNPGW